jgi:hypothetical protein
VTEQLVDAGRAAAVPAAASRLHDALVSRLRVVLPALVAAQIVATAIFFDSVERKGWLVYQGGDQIWLYTTGWMLGHGIIPTAVVSYGWPLVLAPFALVGGPEFVNTLPATIALDVLVLGPIALLALFDIAQRIAGRIFGIWCCVLWIAAPFVSIPFFVDRYHDRWVEQFLPQALGLTQLADYPSMVTVLVAGALILRSFESPRLVQGALAGLIGGWAIALKPANALFLVAAAVAYVLARRWRQGLAFAVALVPAVVTLTLWKDRGLGDIPLFALGATHEALGLGSAPMTASLDHYTHIDWGIWKQNMSNLREFFYSARLVQWAPFAGAVALGRRSIPAAGFLLTWLIAYVLVKGSSPVSSLEGGSFWRLVMPAWPAYLILIAAIPLLVPTFQRRLGDRLVPPRPRPAPTWTIVAVAVVLGALPFVAVATASVQRGPDRAVEYRYVLTPVNGSYVHARAVRDGASVRLEWDDPGGFRPAFYVLLRTQAAGPDVTCSRPGSGADACILTSVDLTRTHDRTFVDTSPVPNATYRVGVAANYIDGPALGDVFVLGEPVPTPSAR